MRALVAKRFQEVRLLEGGEGKDTEGGEGKDASSRTWDQVGT
jgi:hypothetical protein